MLAARRANISANQATSASESVVAPAVAAGRGTGAVVAPGDHARAGRRWWWSDTVVLVRPPGEPVVVVVGGRWSSAAAVVGGAVVGGASSVRPVVAGGGRSGAPVVGGAVVGGCGGRGGRRGRGVGCGGRRGRDVDRVRLRPRRGLPSLATKLTTTEMSQRPAAGGVHGDRRRSGPVDADAAERARACRVPGSVADGPPGAVGVADRRGELLTDERGAADARCR